jgi:hypothetical protein
LGNGFCIGLKGRQRVLVPGTYVPARKDPGGAGGRGQKIVFRWGFKPHRKTSY